MLRAPSCSGTRPSNKVPPPRLPLWSLAAVSTIMSPPQAPSLPPVKSLLPHRLVTHRIWAARYELNICHSIKLICLISPQLFSSNSSYGRPLDQNLCRTSEAPAFPSFLITLERSDGVTRAKLVFYACILADKDVWAQQSQMFNN